MRADMRKISIYIFLSCCILNGCTYQNTIDIHSGSTQNNLSSHIDKSDMNVAIVADYNGLKDLRIFTAIETFEMDIKIGDFILDTAKEELGALFTSVEIIDSLPKSRTHDAYVFVDFLWERFRTGLTSYTLDFKTKLTLRDQTLKYIFGQYEASRREYYSRSSAVQADAILTGASLGLLAPFTIPHAVNTVGKDTEKLVISGVTKTIGNIRNQIVEAGWIEHSVIALKSSTKNTKNKYSEIRSKYDGFLNSVVIISSNKGIGTGFLVSSSGYIISNQHVVGDEKNITVKMKSGEVAIGSVIKKNKRQDLVLIKITGSNYNWIRLSKGDDIKIGGDVLAIGTPEGLSWSISKGIVSAVRTNQRGRYIQTDAAVNHGNSGGPLIDISTGRAIGVNTFGVNKNIAEGLNFAISSEDVLSNFGSYITQ